MKNLRIAIVFTFLLCSCKHTKNKIILPESTGTINKILVVTKANYWLGEVGDKIRDVFGKHLVGLPQPETTLSVSQVAPKGFIRMMKNYRSILIIEQGNKNNFSIVNNKYSAPQTIVSLTAKTKEDLINLIQKNGEKIIKFFKDADIKFLQTLFNTKKLDILKFKTLQNLGLSLIIPNTFNLVEDTGDFLWLRQHLMSGIAKGDGSNNILVYSVPLINENTVADSIVSIRNRIGKKYIPGRKKGMYMITEKAYTPFTFDAKIDEKKAYQTRGKWEVKNDFMAGPFLNYTIIDKKNDRLIVVEGFTYAPSVNKRNFVFELEAIAKSLKIK